MRFSPLLLLWAGFLPLFRVCVSAVHVIGQDTTVTSGEDAILFCQLVDTKEKLTRITWQRRTKKSSANDNIFAITPDGKTEKNGLGNRIEFAGNIQEFIGTIRLKNITSLDHQIYTCIFNIFPSGPFEKEIQLTVPVPPVVSVSPEVIPVIGDSAVILATCTATSRPASEVSWRPGDLNGSVRIKTDRSEEPDDYSTVRSHLFGVPSIALNQHTVHCVVNHPSLKREIQQDYSLVIHYPPQIVYIISVDPPTTSQEFVCVADANPKPTQFTWSRVNKTLPGRVTDRLIIPLSSLSNDLYMCNASNPYGNGISTIYVQISPESCSTCWVLFSVVTIVNALFLLWRVYSSERVKKCISNQRCWSFRAPLPTDSPINAGRTLGVISEDRSVEEE